MSRRTFVSSVRGAIRTALFVAGAICTNSITSGQENAVVSANPSLAEQIKTTVRGVMERSAGAVCRIEGADEHGTLRGTGFLIDADGTVVTSYSVGGQCNDLVVSIAEQKFPASRRLADERSGLAILKIEPAEPLPFLTQGNTSDLEVGSPLIALGFPMDLSISPSFGLLAGFDMKFKERYFVARHLRANVTVQRGQAGSPLLNLKGEAIGVLISTVDNGSGVFALPIEAANKLLRDLRMHGRARQGWLGADVRITNATEFGSSARIRALRPEGPGYKGGLRPGDVLLQIGTRKIESPEDVLDAAFYVTPEETLNVEVARAGKRQSFTIHPTDPPDGEKPGAQREHPAILTDSGMGMGLGGPSRP